jgi:hypothetical protein
MLNCPVARRLQIQESQGNDIRNPRGAIAEHSINYGCAKKQIGYHVCWTRSQHVPQILCFLGRRPIFILTSCSQVLEGIITAVTSTMLEKDTASLKQLGVDSKFPS